MNELLGQVADALRRVRGWLAARPGLVGAGVVALTGGIALVAGLAIGAWNAVCRDCPSIAQIYVWEPKSATRILDRDRKLIAELFFVQRRTPVEIETLPDYVKNAFIAVEDRRFYRHDGFDFRRLASVAVRRLFGRYSGGGSTITQQLARWMFQDEIGFERRIERKLKEARVAQQLEGIYSKDEILEAYINQVNYGAGRHGIEAASQYFFGKSAVELNPAEGALLAGVINAPTDYDPFTHPELARSRRNLVLRLMADQGFLPEAELAQWQAEPLPEAPARANEGSTAPYFVEHVRRILDARFGPDLYVRGYRVVTTLDLEMQHAAEIAMDSGWANLERSPGFRGPTYDEVMAEGGSRNASETRYVQGMFIAMDPATGEVRALIGGRDFADSKFNRATQALRQPGSTFKPFTYAAAIASGIPASHVIYDTPIRITLWNDSIYQPSNFDPEFRGPLTLRDALKHSINTVAVQLGQRVGVETVAQMARQLGIRTEVVGYPSTPIGAESVVPIQITEAYSTFANTGSRVSAQFILRVEDSEGRLLWEPPHEREEALDSMSAAIVRDLLRTALDNGTGSNARHPLRGNLPYEVPAGGKTGTTNDATNVWFIGFTPNLLASVWFGFDRPQKITVSATGGGFAAPVWGQFMRSVYYGDPPELEIPAPWPWPEGITTREVDRMTGRLAAAWCQESTYVEYYVPGTEPTEYCDRIGGRGLFDGPIRMRRDTTDTLGVVRLRPLPILPRQDTLDAAPPRTRDERRQNPRRRRRIRRGG